MFKNSCEKREICEAKVQWTRSGAANQFVFYIFELTELKIFIQALHNIFKTLPYGLLCLMFQAKYIYFSFKLEWMLREFRHFILYFISFFLRIQNLCCGFKSYVYKFICAARWVHRLNQSRKSALQPTDLFLFIFLWIPFFILWILRISVSKIFLAGSQFL